MGYRARIIDKVFLFVLFFWSVLMISVSYLYVNINYNYADSLAKNEAEVSVKKDLAYRSWVASHGGVYVPITTKTPPNPYLAHIKNRDVTTNDNQKLTLMNPAYTLSQMMRDYTKLYGTKGHITSRILMNPKNKPDTWEEEALESVEITRKPIHAKTVIGGEEYIRYLNPLVTKKSCLKCHAFQGYKVGDIRGAVSVSIPLKKYYEKAYAISFENVLIIAFLYLLGLIVLVYGRKKAREILKRKIDDYEQHIFSLVNMIEQRDSYTAGHTKRVAEYSLLIAEKMGFNEEKLDDLNRACMLHDIGKISTPDSILLKPGRLSELEYNIIKEHVVVSYELLKEVDIYHDIAEIVRYHHEQYDGSGYPNGLKGDEIPILSQIMTVADAFDAMTTNRIYKARKSIEEAIAELKEFSGTQFNTQIALVASEVLKDVEIENNITQRPKTKIEKERFSYFYRDFTTSVYNKEYLEFTLSNNHVDEFNLKCVNAIYLHNFSDYNNKNSWANGDELLKKFAEKLVEINKSEFVFRIYGDDFIILNTEHFDLQDYIPILEDVLKDTGVSLSSTHIDIEQEHIKNIEDLERYL